MLDPIAEHLAALTLHGRAAWLPDAQRVLLSYDRPLAECAPEISRDVVAVCLALRLLADCAPAEMLDRGAGAECHLPCIPVPTLPAPLAHEA